MKKFISIGVFFVVIISLIISGCDNRKKQDEALKIGVILPFTGELASYGDPIKKGIEIARTDADTDYPIEIVYSDSKGEARTAANNLQKLINIDSIQYIIGDVSSTVTKTIAPIAKQNNVFLVCPGASSPKLQNINEFFARNYPSSVSESVESAKFLYNEKGIKEAAIVYVNSEYGLGIRDMFKQTFEDLGGRVTLSESYEFGNKDFRIIIAKLRNVRPPAIYLGGNQKEMGHFMRQLRETNYNPEVISNISFLEPDCINIAGEAADSVIVPVAYYNPEDSLMKGAYRFAEKYKNKFNEEPSVVNAVGYDALTLIITAVNKVGNNPAKVAEYVRELKNYDGAVGILNFSKGEVTIPIVFKMIINGKPVVIKDVY
jgi:branched-chain amino acid transport system substrate-binding protein